jgi:hypothetical protein
MLLQRFPKKQTKPFQVEYFEEPLPTYGSVRSSDKPLFHDVDMEDLPPNFALNTIDREPYVRTNF